jgi:Fe2+ or Zn2+ uptake regulation protein
MKQQRRLADTVIADLHDEGNRVTKLREAIFEILSENKRPFSRVEITKALKKKKIVPNRTAFYRVIDDLVRKGVLLPVFFHDQIPRYELVHHGHHHHVVCVNCNAIAEVELSHELDTEERRIESATKFRIHSHSLEFFGLCHTCSLA